MDKLRLLEDERFQTFSRGLDVVVGILEDYGIKPETTNMLIDDYIEMVGDIAGDLMLEYIPRFRFQYFGSEEEAYEGINRECKVKDKLSKRAS